MFVVYANGDEVLITTKDQEAAFLREWFFEADRSPEDYDRIELIETGVQVSTRIVVH